MMLAERRDLRDLAQRLTPEQWAHPSLCAGWSVRDVVAHLVAWDDLLLHRTRGDHVRALARFVWLYGTSLGSMRLLNRRLQRRTRHLGPAELAAELGREADDDLRWLFDGTSPEAHLAEYVVHHADIRRPLGLPDTTPPERVQAAHRGLRQLPGVRAGARRRRGLEAPEPEAADLDLVLQLAGRTTPPG